MKKVMVVGAGASGMIAAITAAREGAKVILLEKNDRVGKKILATGNGKCNLANTNMDMGNYYVKNEKKLNKCFSVFGVEDSISFFQNAGLMLKDKGGYLYPACEQASVVLDILRNLIKNANIDVRTETEVIGVKAEKNKVILTTNIGKLESDSVIFACGSYAGLKKNNQRAGYEMAKELGHSVVEPVPALVQLRCKESIFPSVAGVRCNASLVLKEKNKVLAKENGELQLTDYGISGIPVFQLSRIVARNKCKDLTVEIDFLPEFSSEKWKDFYESRIATMADETAENFLLGILNKKINAMLLKKQGINPAERLKNCKKTALLELCEDMKCFRVTPTGTNPFENAQVCAGGVDFDELSDRLSSCFHDNVYFCGEMIDVDGKCGGYNLQWAWTSGYIAGMNAAKN